MQPAYTFSGNCRLLTVDHEKNGTDATQCFQFTKKTREDAMSSSRFVTNDQKL
jgi:hypothetical protein